MDSKRIRKSVIYFVGWLGLYTCSLIVRITPQRFIYSLARHLAFLGFILAGKQRKIALASLNLAFGKDKTPEEIKDIARECFVSMAKSGVELVFFMDKTQGVRERFHIVGKENLEAALAKGKGVILVSAHFGNFPLMLGRLSLEGYKTGGIMRPMKDRRTEKLFLKERARFGVRTIYSIPRRDCVVTTIRCLRDNELIFIPLDQNFGTAGVFVDFFGVKAATATGPVVLARRTQAQIVLCFIVRQKDDTHKIMLEPALKLVEGKDEEETVFLNVQKITGVIESYIRKYPAEWGWIHRRWKSRPNLKEGGV